MFMFFGKKSEKRSSIYKKVMSSKGKFAENFILPVSCLYNSTDWKFDDNFI